MVELSLYTEIPALEKTRLDAALAEFRQHEFSLDRLVNKSPGIVKNDPSYAANNKAFEDALYEFLKLSEEFHPEPYLDTATPPNRTIGVGFNMDQWGPNLC